MPTRYGQLKFHKEFGPASLFERVKFKFLDPPTRRLNLPKGISVSSLSPELRLSLEAFNQAEWELMWVHVRDDSGKFIHSAWRKRLHEEFWWTVIGYDDFVLRIFNADSYIDGMSPDVVRFGEQFAFVEKVNRELMVKEYEGSDRPFPGPKTGFVESIPDFFFVRRRKTPCAV